MSRPGEKTGAQRSTAVRDALAFRQARHMLYTGSAETERALEINEGVASYTGVAAAADSATGAVTRALELLTAFERDESYVRTFAHTTGPAYGLLLEASSPGWRGRIRNTDDFAALLAGALAVGSATDPAASAARYGGAEIRPPRSSASGRDRNALRSCAGSSWTVRCSRFAVEAMACSTRWAPW